MWRVDVRFSLIPDDASDRELPQWSYHSIIERCRAINEIGAAGTLRPRASNGHLQRIGKGNDVFANLQLVAFAWCEVRLAVLGN